MICILSIIFFFKQKTAYEMRISDWSSDVCSSDLERDQVMTTAIDRRCLSPKRQLLCSRENALRVASRIFDHSQGKVSILRTTDPLQPFRISTDPASSGLIVLEMVA